MVDVAIPQIARELKLTQGQVQATVGLLDGGATVPFVARYRKEATASLDEVVITSIRDRLSQLRELGNRREAILASLEERGLLTEQLREAVLSAESMAVLEDIYLPYRPKRRTRATIAREKGLEPLALYLWEQENFDVNLVAVEYVNPESGVENVDDALGGARDIIAEWVSEDSTARGAMRKLFWSRGTFSCRVVSGKDAAAAKYRDYFEWEEPVADVPSHRVLAMLRGERETLLAIHIAPPVAQAMAILEGIFVKGETEAAQQVRLAVQDGYQRLLESSIETEIRKEARVRAEDTAIKVFADNLRELLLAPVLGQKNVLALDPGFRTGCKLVCLDRQGRLLYHDTVYPLLGGRGEEEAAKKLDQLCGQYHVEAIAVGNGTGGRETEAFLRGLGLGPGIPVVMVNESGASVYSASEVARTEFPNEDITVRGAVSIGRRLMDPLAELVKIDPKAIGVGQYQHDVDQKALKERLDDVVGSCVNNVGVELNTASGELLSYVSGLGPRLAKAIVEHRNSYGPFASRESLKKVPRLGPKAFEQAAGFLRIRDGTHPLDASAVHPESYGVVEAIAKDLGHPLDQLVGDASISRQIDPNRYVSDKVGLPTLKDIIEELARPGRDPRQEFEPFYFAEGVNKIQDLAAGMKLPGVVTNVTGFGAFVDVGVHQDGLVHISQLADRFVRNPSDIVKVQQRVWVTVLEVDLERKRISLSMKG
ncbi:MAG: RNA-binding transcriptional accessory protein [Chloroflexi bacterium]|nr:RNA-binding transcriptional accessory protein [Chloroflexota bacterium]MCI0784890.1 RNA-binding transcriptional accessory protein [Chloroflexota bacterium]MCI0792061.1 RNA-binding transcriptional accessory protein [Chloroflexota bacterium]MCI0797207.1 RNA-binding transcriptional accessory protein [Chloroflexota bacterium]MCI0824693.1 RNA-binding transcriptional accessory protein [Chloroflexota bacterium]